MMLRLLSESYHRVELGFSGVGGVGGICEALTSSIL